MRRINFSAAAALSARDVASCSRPLSPASGPNAVPARPRITPERFSPLTNFIPKLSYSSPAHASPAALLGECDLRGMRVNCASSRSVRPGLLAHRISIWPIGHACTAYGVSDLGTLDLDNSDV